MIATSIAYRLRILSVAAILGLSLESCEVDSDAVGGRDDSNVVKGIAAFIVSRAEASTGEGSDNGDEDSAGDSTGFDIDALIPYTLKFNASTVLQVSQKGPGSLMPFQGIPTYDYQYIPSYKEPEDGDAWSDPNCYNFTPSMNSEQLEWNKIIEVGSVSAAYPMYCLYFPGENQIRQARADNDMIYYYVHKDQSSLEKLRASDILGAYHSTNQIFERIRFKLHHLMTYLRIRLYVPIYDDTKHTGYREGSLLYATLDGANPNFTIEWTYVLATEDPLRIVPLAGEDKITMYQHPLPEGTTQHPLVEIPYKKYLRSGYPDQGITGDYDKVRVYDFSVIIPPQLTNKEGGTGSFADEQFLNFYLRTNAGGTTRYYFTQDNKGIMNTDQDNDKDKNEDKDQNVLDLNQGVFQYLQLYLPRVGNQIVFVGAQVNPWTHTHTDMFLESDQVQQP